MVRIPQPLTVVWEGMVNGVSFSLGCGEPLRSRSRSGHRRFEFQASAGHNFIEALVRPHVMDADLEEAYREKAREGAREGGEELDLGLHGSH